MTREDICAKDVRILLIYPSRIGRGNIPINIPILQAVLKQNGYEVKIFDNTNYYSFKYNALLTQMGVFKKTDYEKYDNLLYRSDRFADFETLCRQFNPHIIGVSCLTSDFEFSLDYVRIAKKLNPRVITLYGGIHPTIMPEEVLNHPEVDFICVGEGEEALLNFTKRFSSGDDLLSISNIWGKQNGKIVKNTLRKLVDLDTIPFQDFSGFEEFQFYHPFDGKVYRMLNAEVSRGCVFGCSYCVNHTLQQIYKGLGRYYRTKSVERAIAELVYLKDKHNFTLIRFWDDDFTTKDELYLENFGKAYREKVNLPFIIYSRCETITEKKVKLLKDMGCVTFAIGIESGDENIRRHIMNRNVSNDEIIEKFNLVHKYNIRVSAYNIIGVPSETRASIFNTIELNRKCDPATSNVFFFAPYPKTKMMDELIKEGSMPPNYTFKSDFSEISYEPSSITKKELYGLYKTFNLYRKLPRYLFPLIKLCEQENKISQRLYSFLVLKYLKGRER